MRFLMTSAHLALALALTIPAHGYDARTNFDTALSRVRTQVSLVLYSQVMFELIEHSEGDKTSWLAKLQSAVLKDYDPAKAVDTNRKCLISGIETWGKMTEKGEKATTAELTESLLTSDALSKECKPFWETLVGKESHGHANGQFLLLLQDAELIPNLQARKLAHIEAVKMALITSGQRHLGAAAKIAAYYKDDNDPQISSAAESILTLIPSAEKAKALFSVVRPDTLMLPVPMTMAALRLVSRLPNSLAIKAFMISIGAHLAGGAWLMSSPSSSQSQQAQQSNQAIQGKNAQKFEMEIEKNPKASEPWLRFTLKIISEFANDLFARPQFLASAERSVRHVVRLNKDNIDFSNFFVQLDMNYVPNMNSLEFDSYVRNLHRLSEETGKKLADRSEPLQKRIDAARELIFKQTKIGNYRKGQRDLVPMLQGLGGDCVANTKLMLTAFWPHRNLLEPNTILAVEIFRDHIQPVIYDTKSESTIDLVSGRLYRKARGAIYHAAVLVNGLLIKQKRSSYPEDRFLIKSAVKSKVSGAGEPSLEEPGAGGVESTLDLPDISGVSTGEPPVERATMTFKPVKPFTDREQSAPRSFEEGSNGSPDESPDGSPNRGQGWQRLFGANRKSGNRPPSPGSARGGYPYSNNYPVSSDYYSSTWSEPAVSNSCQVNVYSPGFPPPSRSNFNMNDRKTFDVVWICYSSSNEPLGYDLAVPTDELRKAILETSDGRARGNLLFPLVIAEAKERMGLAAWIKALLMNPLVEKERPAFGGIDANYFRPERLLEKIRDIEHLRTRRDLDLSKPNDVNFILQTALSIPEINASIALDLEVLELLARSPEAIARIFDSPQVPMANKENLSNILYNGLIYNPANSKSPPSLIPEEYRLAVRAAAVAFEKAVADPTAIGISENIVSQALQVPQVQVLTTQSKSPVKINMINPVKAQGPIQVVQVPLEVLPVCTSTDTTGRCREQDIAYSNKVPARTYVSPKTYFKMVLLFQYAPESLGSQLAKRWDRQMERLFIDYLINEAKQGWKLALENQKRPKEEQRPVELFQAYRGKEFAKRFKDRFKDSPWKVIDQQVEFENNVRIEKNVEIPTSRGFFEVEKCSQVQREMDKKMEVEFGLTRRDSQVKPEQMPSYIKAYSQIVDSYVQCLQEGRSRL